MDIYNDGSYLSSNAAWHEEDAEWKFNQLKEYLEKAQFRTIADVGCGTGAVLDYIKSSFNPVSLFGFEISKDASMFWEDKHKDIVFELSSIFDSSRNYDIVLALDVFEHIEDYFSFLRALRLKGNQFIFHIPLDLFAMASVMNNYIHKRESVGHIHFFDLKTAIATLENCGYEVMEYKLTKAYQIANTKKAKRLKMLRKISEKIIGDVRNARIMGGYSMMVYCKVAPN